jgi:hypothetical protein
MGCFVWCADTSPDGHTDTMSPPPFEARGCLQSANVPTMIVSGLPKYLGLPSFISTYKTDERDV